MGDERSHPKSLAWFSPWLIIGSVCILGAILLILTVRNVRQEREYMDRMLLSEGNVLLRSLEASARTGMMGMGWGRGQLQQLMEETSQEPDIHYVALVTSHGQILAHSDPGQVGKIFPYSLPATGESEHRFVNDVERSFEVIRPYQPWRKHRGWRGGGEGGISCPNDQTDSDPGGFILVGLDPGPFEAAINNDIQRTSMLTVVLFLIGATSFASLSWAQHYRSARRSLRDIRAFTSTILNQMPVGLIATDLDGRVQTTNDAARHILKGQCDVGECLSGFSCFAPVIERLRSKGAPVEEEVLFSSADSVAVPLLVTAAIITDGESRVAGDVLLLTDMTNVRQLEEQLRRSERLASLGRLAAGVAHEIRNPLSSIKGFAKILAGKVGEDSQGKKIAQVMEQEVERLNRVITELLDFARPTELKKRPCPCTDLIQQTLRLVEPDAKQQGVKIESPTVEPRNLNANVDPDRFAQVLLNLYLNALQAMEDGGSLQIRVEEQADRLRWIVRDTGKGISKENLAHIFDPYFTTKPHGVGLGLAIVHKLVEAHGGDIDVESTPGKGTDFVIRVPKFHREDGVSVTDPAGEGNSMNN